MVDTEVVFQDWWQAFLADARDGKDPQAALKDLCRFVDGLPTTKREAFVVELIDLACQRSEGWDFALGALERFAGPDARRSLAAAVAKVPPVRPPHALGDYRHGILRVLASDPLGEYLGPVKAYCAEKIGPGYTSVVWALWPHQKGLFAAAHARYFVERSPNEWAHTAVVQAFTTEPEALTAVRDALLDLDRPAWNAVRGAVLASIVAWRSTEEQTEQIRRVCDAGAA